MCKGVKDLLFGCCCNSFENIYVTFFPGFRRGSAGGSQKWFDDFFLHLLTFQMPINYKKYKVIKLMVL